MAGFMVLMKILMPHLLRLEALVHLIILQVKDPHTFQSGTESIQGQEEEEHGSMYILCSIECLMMRINKYINLSAF